MLCYVIHRGVSFFSNEKNDSLLFGLFEIQCSRFSLPLGGVKTGLHQIRTADEPA